MAGVLPTRSALESRPVAAGWQSTSASAANSPISTLNLGFTFTVRDVALTDAPGAEAVTAFGQVSAAARRSDIRDGARS
jgi:hypothetical protein